jgi:ribonuclease P protein component
VKKQFTLGKTERLKSRKAIDKLFKEGKKFSAPPFRIFYVVTVEKGIQFGAGVSTRNFKKAVDRNRIKRLIRESWRLQKITLQDKLLSLNKGLHVFFIYTEKELPAYKQVFECVELALRKLNNVIEK